MEKGKIVQLFGRGSGDERRTGARAAGRGQDRPDAEELWRLLDRNLSIASWKKERE